MEDKFFSYIMVEKNNGCSVPIFFFFGGGGGGAWRILYFDKAVKFYILANFDLHFLFSFCKTYYSFIKL